MGNGGEEKLISCESMPCPPVEKDEMPEREQPLILITLSVTFPSCLALPFMGIRPPIFPNKPTCCLSSQLIFIISGSAL